jgi:hypothetical protein
MNLRLDPRNGHLCLPSGCIIHPALRPAEVTALGTGQPPSHRDMGNGWHWYDLGFSDAPYYLGVNLGFF